MTLDEQLLKKAQREAARFAELERDAHLLQPILLDGGIADDYCHIGCVRKHA